MLGLLYVVCMQPLYHCGIHNSIATDVIKSKLETAKIMGADVVVDGTQQSLQEVGEQCVQVVCMTTEAMCSDE